MSEDVDGVGILADARTGSIVDEIGVESASWQESIGAATSFSSVVLATDERAANILEGATVLHLLEGDEITASALIELVHWEDNKLTLQGSTLRTWLDRRALRTDKTYAAQDQFAIASDLLAYANASSLGIGITERASVNGGPLTPGATSGITRTVAYAASERRYIGAILDDLAKLDSGFDWDVTCEWVATNTIGRHLDLWYPSRGLVTALAWEHGKGSRIKNYDGDATNLASLVDVTGNGNGGTTPFGTATEALTAWPRYDLIESAKDTAETSMLGAIATAELTRNHRPIEVFTVDGLDHSDGADTNPSQWRVGDSVQYTADLGAWRKLDGLYRAVSATYSYANGIRHADDVTLTTLLPGDPIGHPSWYRGVSKLAKRVARLERR